MEDTIFDVKGCAEFLHYTVASIYKKIQEGTIPYIKLEGGKNGKVLFSKNELLKFLYKCKVDAKCDEQSE